MKKRVLVPHRPLYVLGYKINALFVRRDGKRSIEVFERLRNVPFPGDTVINIEGQKYGLRRKFRQMSWAKSVSKKWLERWISQAWRA